MLMNAMCKTGSYVTMKFMNEQFYDAEQFEMVLIEKRNWNHTKQLSKQRNPKSRTLKSTKITITNTNEDLMQITMKLIRK